MYSLLYSFLILFYIYYDYRDLHSFPTRRSSDLVTAITMGASTDVAAFCTTLWTSAAVSPTTGVEGGAEIGGVCAPPQPTDRKSTRLNSSHQIISYAVFCLKKKNTS